MRSLLHGMNSRAYGLLQVTQRNSTLELQAKKQLAGLSARAQLSLVSSGESAYVQNAVDDVAMAQVTSYDTSDT